VKKILVLSAVFIGQVALAQSSVSSLSAGSITRDAVAAGSRSEALKTESSFYSVPRQDMTYFEVGAYNQRQNYSVNQEDTKTNDQAFFFQHSRGLTEDLALDFGFNYFMHDQNSRNNSTGINRISLGGKSTFEGIWGLSWVYGAHVAYLPQGENSTSDSKAIILGQIGFEERVDIARWGLQFAPTTEDGIFSKDQFTFEGFFEIPVVRSFDLGIQGGADLAHLTDQEQENYAQFYGQYGFDKVSAAKVFLRQRSAKSFEQTASLTEAGLSISKVF